MSGLFNYAESGNNAPGKQALEAYTYLSGLADEQLQKLSKIIHTDIPKFNGLIRDKALPVVGLKNE
jgi:hypothetical protein